MVKKALKTLDNTNGIRRSTQLKYLVQILTYDDFVVHHYAYVDKKVIRCKWVYKVKHNVDGSVSRYKTSLVTKGYAQTYGIDYEETYSLIAKMMTIRAIIVMATTKG
jgi:hypothetical protein